MAARFALLCGAFLATLMLGTGTTWWLTPQSDALDAEPAALPRPPLPIRISHSAEYEHCLAAIADDPQRAIELSDAWRARAGEPEAVHCSALAYLATGDFALGASHLERLGRSPTLPDLERAIVFSQSVEARLLSGDPERALEDADEALRLVPPTTGLLILRASASLTLGRSAAAVDDLTEALYLDNQRQDAMVMRATALRDLDRLDEAAADLEHALGLVPDDPEALLERGILRQRRGDTAGAREDWQRVRALTSTGLVADLADQNLALLDAGPLRR
ncbi:MAG: tetratricopeptide repeat protein [Acetobacteraceae bacterium]